MILKLLTEHHLEFLSFKGGCRGLSESTHAKMPQCWKSHAQAQICQPYSVGNENFNVFMHITRRKLPTSCRLDKCPILGDAHLCFMLLNFVLNHLCRPVH